MFDILKILLDIVKDLLPNKELKNHVWISRFLLLVTTFILMVYIGFYNFKETELAKTYGLSDQQIVVTLPTLAEFAQIHRTILNWLSNFKSNSNGQISNIFLIALYSRQANDYVPTAPEDNKDLLIFAWSVPVQKFSNLDDTQLALNTNPNLIFNNEWKTHNEQCYTQEIPPDFLSILKSIYVNENSTNYTICKIYDRYKRNTIAFTISFYHIKDLLEANVVEYKQKEVTIDVSKGFSKFTIPYLAKHKNSRLQIVSD